MSSDNSSMGNVFLGILLVIVIVLLLFFGLNYMRGGANSGNSGGTNKISGEINLPNVPVPTIPTGTGK